jgi:hypothetical protein
MDILLEFAIGFAAFMAGWYALHIAAEKLKQWSIAARRCPPLTNAILRLLVAAWVEKSEHPW